MIRPMRLRNRAMKEEKARKLLAECEYALFTTVDEEGAPHTVPVSPVVLGNALYFHCAPAGEKLDNIQKNPQVCLCALGRTQVLQKEMTMAYESVVAQGKARLAQGEEAQRALWPSARSIPLVMKASGKRRSKSSPWCRWLPWT